MWLGIDVGGTFTDAVIITGGKLVAVAKTPTTLDLLTGILNALDEVLTKVDAAAIRRVALSTTLVTNTLVEGRNDPVALLLMPGPGLDMTPLSPVTPWLLSGYVDHRGRETAPPRRGEVEIACRQLPADGVVAVAGKFSVRNPLPEATVAGWVRELAAPRHISLGSEMSGGLNFPRRMNSAYFNASVWRAYGRFASVMEEGLHQRKIKADVHILKGDGGTMPLAVAARMPVETIFTGPAASVLGIMALQTPVGDAISLDIGGTTTDIALWRNGLPLLAAAGARIQGFPTAVRSYWLRSVGIGGDSYVRRDGERLLVGPQRRGPAMAVGGEDPTVTDALRVTEAITYGDAAKARRAMAQVALPGQSLRATAEEILTVAIGEICRNIGDMMVEEAAAPVYRVEDIIHPVKFAPASLLGVGGGAPGLAPRVAASLAVACHTPRSAQVANAIGAAVARPTTQVTLRADTVQKCYVVPELGLRRELPNTHMSADAAWELAAKYLQERAGREGIAEAPGAVPWETERVLDEEFNVVRGFRTMGKIMTCRLQVKPGVLTAVNGGEGI
ncbi:MAG TPA: hydantoinase/oxoprolinase family protein [Patescibacteria group bacterium]|nr:hydantoinase/oxoprolinase family protein [Patescibacteria group bacterium]